MLATTAAEVRKAAAEHKIAALMGMEGGHMIDDDVRLLRLYAALGVRYMTLTHFKNNNWADSSTDAAAHNGLTPLGKDIVREMNRLGMMVDISHVADATFWDVLETTRSPVIASHSSCRALANHPRNLTDEMLRALGTNGGIIMLNFADEFVDQRVVDFKKQMREFESAAQKKYPEDPEKARAECQAYYSTNYPRPPVSLLVNHIEHVVKVAGIDHVGLGSDFDGEIRPPIGLEDVACFPRITASLAQRGYSDGDIKKVLGENLLRVMAAVEAVGEARVERLE
jgi:membrane dipeptidase